MRSKLFLVALLATCLLILPTEISRVTSTVTSEQPQYPKVSFGAEVAVGGGSRLAGIRTSAVWPLSSHKIEGSDSTSYPTFATGIDVDENGSIAVCGYTKSTDLTITSNGLNQTPPAATQYNGFIQIWSPAGDNGISSCTYGSYWGGASNDFLTAVDIDSEGRLHCVGYSESDNSSYFVTKSAFWMDRRGNYDCIYFVIDPSRPREAQLLYSTYFGGSGDDWAYDVEFDGQNNVTWICGVTESNVDFPRGSAYSLGSGLEETFAGGTSDAFLFALNYTASKIFSGLYSTFLGSSSEDSARSLSISNTTKDGQEVCVVGLTDGSDFGQISTGAYDTLLDGVDSSWFIVEHRVKKSGSDYAGYLNYGSFLGRGLDQDTAKPYSWPRVDYSSASGYYVVGGTVETGWPVTGKAPQKTNNGGLDGYLAYLEATGNGAADLKAGSYFGNSSDEHIFTVVIDSLDQVVIAGSTTSTDLVEVGERSVARSSDTFRDVFFGRMTPASAWGFDVNFSSAHDTGYLWSEVWAGALDERSNHLKCAGIVNPTNTLISKSLITSHRLPTECYFEAIEVNTGHLDGKNDILRIVGNATPSSETLIGAPIDHTLLTLEHANGTTQEIRGWLQDDDVPGIYEVNVTFRAASNVSYSFTAITLDNGQSVASSGRLRMEGPNATVAGNVTTDIRPDLAALIALLPDYPYYIIAAAFVGPAVVSSILVKRKEGD